MINVFVNKRGLSLPFLWFRWIDESLSHSLLEIFFNVRSNFLVYINFTFLLLTLVVPELRSSYLRKGYLDYKIYIHTNLRRRPLCLDVYSRALWVIVTLPGCLLVSRTELQTLHFWAFPMTWSTSKFEISGFSVCLGLQPFSLINIFSSRGWSELQILLLQVWFTENLSSFWSSGST